MMGISSASETLLHALHRLLSVLLPLTFSRKKSPYGPLLAAAVPSD